MNQIRVEVQAIEASVAEDDHAVKRTLSFFAACSTVSCCALSRIIQLG